MINKQQCTWFPKQGTYDLDIWERVQKTLKAQHSEGANALNPEVILTQSLVHSALVPLSSYNVYEDVELPNREGK